MKLTIATRGSKLALWQAHYVKDLLAQQNCQCEIQVISTKGDRVQDRFLHEVGGKGLFIKELEVALQEGEADLAVHSLKDMPAKIPQPFVLGAVLPRHSHKDVLIAGGDFKEAIGKLTEASAADIANLGPMKIATASLRRTNLLKKHTPQVECIGIRGNVDTRIAKLHQEGYGGLILAHASMERLEINSETYCTLAPDWFVPSPAQGALAIECKEDHPVRKVLQAMDDPVTHKAVGIERQLLADLGGDCTMPFGCFARLVEEQWHCDAVVLAYDGAAARTSVKAPKDATIESLSESLQKQLKEDGLDEVLAKIASGAPDLQGDFEAKS